MALLPGHRRNRNDLSRLHTERDELFDGSFRRDVTLPADVEYGKVEAECKDGVLSIKLPKAEKAKALKVKVKG